MRYSKSPYRDECTFQYGSKPPASVSEQAYSAGAARAMFKRSPKMPSRYSATERASYMAGYRAERCSSEGSNGF